jgi:pantoate--beta-alanine ligase
VLTLRTVGEVRAWPRSGSVGLVPTMGAFHDGHLSLIDAARRENDHVVVWLFVNPAQFDEAGDLAAYPRDEARDAALAAEHGADVLFAPAVEEVYPEGFATTVTVGGLGDTLEGAHRPGHFAGVATVVTKMLNMVRPDRAYFGAKDAQQVALVRRLVRDLDIPTAIVTLPTVREADGLALSSRNVHLDPQARERAAALSRGLRAARESGERDAAALRLIVETTIRAAGVEPEYVAVVAPETFAPVTTVNGRALIAVAARVGTTRLIDNIAIGAEEA